MSKRGNRPKNDDFFDDEDGEVQEGEVQEEEDDDDEEDDEEDEDEDDDDDIEEDEDDEDFEDDFEIDEEELDLDEVTAINDGLIEEFEEYLLSKRFSATQMSSHLKCVEFFSDDYLIDFAVGSLDGISKEEVIDEFLGDYFIRQACQGKDDLKQMVQALRSFYLFVAECYGTEEEGTNARDILKHLDKEERKLYKRLKRWEEGYSEDF